MNIQLSVNRIVAYGDKLASDLSRYGMYCGNIFCDLPIVVFI